jgi:hypothetical protein
MNIEEVKSSWGLGLPKGKGKTGQNRFSDGAVVEIKKTLCDLMKDIESLT